MRISDFVLNQMAHGALGNYATPGLTSYLVGNSSPDTGTVRLFNAERETENWITPHSHRFDFACCVLQGTVENILFLPASEEAGGVFYDEGVLLPVDGGLGKYKAKAAQGRRRYRRESRFYRENEWYAMQAHQIHSIRFSADAVVLFLEGPQKTTETRFLEPPGVRTFKVEPWMFTKDFDDSEELE